MMRSLPAILLVALSCVPVAWGRQVQSVGTEASFDVATWNIEWFGASFNGPSNDAMQRENVQTIIESSDIDVWALQEIADTDAFATLLTNLGPDWAGSLATQSGTQRVGFVYRTSVVTPRRTEHILTDFSASFAGRPPWYMEANITLPDTTFVVSLVTIHMKAFSDLDSYSKRLDASMRMKNRFDFFESSANLIVLGDYNDELATSITSGQASPYKNFVDDPDHYRFLTRPLEDAGTCTYCGSSLTSTIDHIMVTDELFSAAAGGATERHSSVITGISGFLSTTSDHVPVFTRFVPSATGTAVERWDAVSPDTAVRVWPNPGRGVINVAGATDSAYRLVDVLGRTSRQGVLSEGRLDVSRLSAGVYVLILPGRPSTTVVVR